MSHESHDDLLGDFGFMQLRVGCVLAKEVLVEQRAQIQQRPRLAIVARKA